MKNRKYHNKQKLRTEIF